MSFKNYGGDGTAAAPAEDGVVHVDDVSPESWVREKAGIEGVARNIGNDAGTRLIGVDVTEIPPGRSASHRHHHTLKEEFFYVLSGRCKVRIGTREHDLRPGSAVARPAGTGVPHQFFNPYEEPCRVLMLGAMEGEGVADEVVWPELKRAMVVAPDGTSKMRRL